MRHPLSTLAALLLTALSTLPFAGTAAASELVLILDASGSMWGQIEGENKIVIARRVLGEVVDGLADDTTLGLVAYGHRREGDCADVETVVPLGPLDRDGVKATVGGLDPKGKTPITAAVEEAIGLVRGGDGGATVILVSDGLETCGGDPCAAVRAAREEGVDFLLHVVGFDVEGEEVSQLECAAQAGGGLFLSAEDADQLAGALDAAVALPAETPAGRLSVRAVTDGELQDVAISVTRAGDGSQAAVGRTYADPGTNPRSIPLPDGRYRVEIQAVGLRGDVERSFDVEIADGSTVEKEVDFSSGELAVGVTRNGELSDATVTVRVAGDAKSVASGRTYASANSNPKAFRITAGRYDVEIGSVEISGKPTHRWRGVTVEPGGRTELEHAFESGTLRVGATRGGELADATVRVRDAATGEEVAGGRTYTSDSSNPKSFVLEPGDYRVEVEEIRGDGSRELTLQVTAGGEVEKVVDFGAEG